MGSQNPENNEIQDMDDSGCVQDGSESENGARWYPDLLDLSDDVLLYILKYLSPRDLKALGHTCPRLGRLICDRTLWTRVDARATPVGQQRLRWLLNHCLSPSTTELQITGYANKYSRCLGIQDIQQPPPGCERDHARLGCCPQRQAGPDVDVEHFLLRMWYPHLPRYAVAPRWPDQAEADSRIARAEAERKRAADVAAAKIADAVINAAQAAENSAPKPGCSGESSSSSGYNSGMSDQSPSSSGRNAPEGDKPDQSSSSSGPKPNSSVQNSHTWSPPSTQKPEGLGQNSGSSAPIPSSSTQNPEGLGPHASSSAQNSSSTAQNPEGWGQNASAQIPNGWGQNASSSAPKPSCSAQNPGNSGQKPGSSAQNPGSSAQNPGSSAQNPGSSAQNSGSPAPKPGCSGQNADKSKAKKEDKEFPILFEEDVRDGCKGPQFSLSKNLMLDLRRKCRDLTSLALEYCNLDYKTTNLRHFPSSLRKLSLRGTSCYNIPLNASFVGKIQDRLPALEYLDLSECDWLEPSSLMPVSKLSNLIELYMRDCKRLTECVAYASLATRYGFRKLKVFDVRGSPLSDTEVSSLSWLPCLEELYVSPPEEYSTVGEHTHSWNDVRTVFNELDSWEIEEPDYYKISPDPDDEMKDEEIEGDQAVEWWSQERRPHLHSIIVIHPNGNRHERMIMRRDMHVNDLPPRLQPREPRPGDNQDPANPQPGPAHPRPGAAYQVFPPRVCLSGTVEFVASQLNPVTRRREQIPLEVLAGRLNPQPVQADARQERRICPANLPPCLAHPLPGCINPQAGPAYQPPGPENPQQLTTDQQSGPAYPPSGSTYQQPGPAYQQPGSTYQQPGPAYQQPGPAYQPPCPAYQEPGPVYQPPGPTNSQQYPANPQPGPANSQPGPSNPSPSPGNSQPEPATPESGPAKPPRARVLSESDPDFIPPAYLYADAEPPVIPGVPQPLPVYMRPTYIYSEPDPSYIRIEPDSPPQPPNPQPGPSNNQQDPANPQPGPANPQNDPANPQNDPENPQAGEGTSKRRINVGNAIDLAKRRRVEGEDQEMPPQPQERQAHFPPYEPMCPRLRLAEIEVPDCEMDRNQPRTPRYVRFRRREPRQIMQIEVDAPTNHIANPAGYQLVTDSSLLRFGRSENANINYVDIGNYDGPGRPERSTLRVLSVTGYRNITDRSLRHLVLAAPNLLHIDFSETSVTPQGVEIFKAVRPDCNIVFSEFRRMT